MSCCKYFNKVIQMNTDTCKKCPYGGECLETGVSSKPQFWGAILDGNILFYSCMPTHCSVCQTNCSGDNFDLCSSNRQGPICTECVTSYTEALFTSSCVPDDQCTDSWFWPVIIMVGVVYSVFLLFQEDIFNFILKRTDNINENLPQDLRETDTKISQNHEIVDTDNEHEQDHDVMRTDHEISQFSDMMETECDIKASDDTVENDIMETESNIKVSHDTVVNDADIPHHIEETDNQTQHQDSSFLINLFYYFQDSALLSVITPYSISDTSSITSLKEIVAGLFEFRLDVLHLGKDICVIPGLSVVGKTILKTSFFPLIWLTILIIYGFSNFLPHRVRVMVFCRCSNAFTLSILFTFQKLAVAYFSLVQCVPFLLSSVLQIQATTPCYTYWQIVVLVYLGVCIIPFSFYLIYCSKYLERAQISLVVFFAGCLFPLPVIVYCIILSCKQRLPSNRVLTPDAKVVVDIIQGPYKVITVFGGAICWGGVVVLRRTLLIVLYTFVQSSLLRSLLIFFLCLLYMFVHTAISPFTDYKSNIAESVSQGVLTLLSGLNLLKATIDSQQTVPSWPTQNVLNIIHYVDMLFLLFIPIAGISILFITFLYKTLITLKSKFISLFTL